MIDDVAACPVRKLVPEGEPVGGPDLERQTGPDGTRLLIRSHALAREALRAEAGLVQQGFGADQVRRNQRMRPPVLYLDGPAHRTQRRAAARFFTPKAVEAYRPMIEARSEELVAQIRADRATDLSALSMRLAVEVVGRVVGMTNSSRPGMTRRLATFFAIEEPGARWSPRRLADGVRRNTALLRFHWLDVKPAIRARKRARQDDVISTLIDDDFTDLDILVEAMTYGAAGMVTTRELITVGAWHLMDDEALLARFRAGDRADRTAVVEELLRLEPVVGHLVRRATHPVTLDGPDGPVEVRPGDLVDVNVRDANADERVAGADPLELCPGRPLAKGTAPTLMSFGDGHHKCPGGPIAVMEAEIFLSALFREDVAADGPPRVRWNPVSQGYDLDRLMVRRRPAAGPAA